MNFYKDPLLEKLRLIESRILGEALSDDEFVELQRLRAELADDPAVSKLHSEVDAVVTARARDFEKPSGTSANTPADTPGDSASSVEWPTTPEEIKAFQKANKLKPDGLIGQKTMAALVAAGATPPAGFKPVGNKATTRPSGQAPQPTPASTNPEVAKIDAEIKRFTSGGNNMSLQANKDYVASLEKKKAALMAGSAAQPGNPNLDVLNKIPNPTQGQEYWKDGERFQYRIASAPGTPGAVMNGWYKNFEKGDMIGTTTNKMASRFNYTGAPEGIDAFLAKKGATNESIDRIRHLSGL